MSLKFVVGPAGAGKSSYIYDYLVEESGKNKDTNYFLIVPDQFTMQTQMDIVKKNNNGIMNIDVLSFSRLAHRIFEETGKPSYPVLDDTGKSLVLRSIAAGISEKMPYIGKHLQKTGYIHEIKSSISEFKQYGISVKDLKDISDKVEDGVMKYKLGDLAVVYEAFEEYKNARFITKEETLEALCDKLTQSVIIKKTVVIFDGFTGFTPIQEAVIRKLLTLSKKVIVTLTMRDESEVDNQLSEEKLFYLTSRTAQRLKKIANDESVEIEKTVLLDGSMGRFSGKPALSFLENNLFAYPKKPFEGENNSIEIFAASTVSAEVDAICNKIYDLLLTGEYKYRDIAIVTGNLESYGSLFETRFEQLKVPCFIDRTNAIGLNPFIEYLKSAMQIIVQDYSFDSVMHFLRSGFTDFTEDEVDRFERYIRSLNIRGSKKYHNTFRRPQFDMRRSNEKDRALLEVPQRDATRAKLVELMAPLERKMETAGDYTRALYEFLTGNNSFERLDEMADFFEEDNQLSKAVEYRQIYRHIMDLCDTIVSLVGDEKMSLKEYYKIFEAGIDEIKVGTIPKGVDRILVGDIERTRLNETKALFFAGVNDTNIPKGGDKGGILSSVDRENLKDILENNFASKGYCLAPSPREQMYTQRLYLYMNMCKPTEKLYISYAAIAADGSGMRPSYLVETVRRLYKNMEVTNVEKTDLSERIISLQDSFKYYSQLIKDYASGLKDDVSEEILTALYNLYLTNNEDETAEMIHEAAFYQYVGKPLSEEIAKALYGDILTGSVSRFEKYAKCAYSHFLSYGIGLNEASEYEFGSLDMGNVCHEILDKFSDALKLKSYSFKDFPDEEGYKILDEVIEAVLESDDLDILNEDKANAYIKIKISNIMHRTVRMLKYQLSRGDFIPSFNEKKVIGEIDLVNDAKARFFGKIDRIDLCHKDDKVYVKVVDYKSSEHSLDVTKIYYGLEQQLISYMSAAIDDVAKMNPGKEVLPSSIFYYTMKNPFLKAKGELSAEQIDKELKKEFKLSGLVVSEDDNIYALDHNAAGDEADIIPVNFNKSGEIKELKSIVSMQEMDSLMNYVSRMTKRIGDNIITGDIKISPIELDSQKTACDYCPYKTVCRFDDRIKGYRMRSLGDTSQERAKEQVLGGVDNGKDYIFE